MAVNPREKAIVSPVIVTVEVKCPHCKALIDRVHKHDCNPKTWEKHRKWALQCPHCKSPYVLPAYPAYWRTEA